MAYHQPISGSLTCTDLRGTLPLLAQGKVRDVYTLSSDTLLFVATDRISAYDVILKNVCFFNYLSFPFLPFCLDKLVNV